MLRKTLIYKTGVEYGDYTLNHVQGCSHGCMYPCYAFMMAKRFGKINSYEDWTQPNVVENALELLSKEIPKYKDRIKILHLCFTTDPFMYGHDEIGRLSIEIIQKANFHGIRCSVLTKGVLPIELAQLSSDNEYGISLVSLDNNFVSNFEPGAATVIERIDALKQLSDRGYYTWVSIEPYPTPNLVEQNLLSILEEVSFVDKIIFGRLHYNKIVSAYRGYKEFYNECANTVVEYCKSRNIDFYIKKRTISEN